MGLTLHISQNFEKLIGYLQQLLCLNVFGSLIPDGNRSAITLAVFHRNFVGLDKFQESLKCVLHLLLKASLVA